MYICVLLITVECQQNWTLYQHCVLSIFYSVKPHNHIPPSPPINVLQHKASSSYTSINALQPKASSPPINVLQRKASSSLNIRCRLTRAFLHVVNLNRPSSGSAVWIPNKHQGRGSISICQRGHIRCIVKRHQCTSAAVCAHWSELVSNRCDIIGTTWYPHKKTDRTVRPWSQWRWSSRWASPPIGHIPRIHHCTIKIALAFHRRLGTNTYWRLFVAWIEPLAQSLLSSSSSSPTVTPLPADTSHWWGP